MPSARASIVGSRVEVRVRRREVGVVVVVGFVVEGREGMVRFVCIGGMVVGDGEVRVSRMESCSGERKVGSKVGRDGGGGCFEVEVETGMEGASFESSSLSLTFSFGGLRRSSHVLRSSCNL